MIKRIELLMQAQNLTSSQFADRIGVQRSGLSHILSGRNNPSLDFVLKVLAAFPEIDPLWLLQGKGKMYASLSETSSPVFPKDSVRTADLFGTAQGENASENASSVSFSPEKPPVSESGEGRDAGAESKSECLQSDGGDVEIGGQSPSDFHISGNIRSGNMRSEAIPFPEGRSGAKALVRIVFFYEDGTFRDFRPEKG